MPLPWMKMWLEALDDSKLIRLSLAERGAWWGLLKLAGVCAAGGKLVSGGEGLDIDEITDALHIKTAEDKQVLESMIAKMQERGSLQWNGRVLFVVHYEERQRIPPSARPAAVAERVRLFRERKREKDQHKKIQAYLYCPKCHYRLERTKVTERMSLCPNCGRKGKEVKLEVRKA